MTLEWWIGIGIFIGAGLLALLMHARQSRPARHGRDTPRERADGGGDSAVLITGTSAGGKSKQPADTAADAGTDGGGGGGGGGGGDGGGGD